MENIRLIECHSNSNMQIVTSMKDALEIIEQRCGSDLADYIRDHDDRTDDIEQELLKALKDSFEACYCDLSDAIEAVKDGIETTTNKKGKKTSKLTKEALITLLSASEQMLNKINNEIEIY